MRLLLAIYSGTGYRECPLPEEDNTDCRLCLEAEFTGGSGDLWLKLEVLRGQWRLYTDVLETEGAARETPVVLLPGGYLHLHPEPDTKLTVAVRERSADLWPMRKIWLSEELSHRFLKIGRGESCDLSFPHQKTMSGVHAVMSCRNGAWQIECRSPNGIYVNGRLCSQRASLRFGDRLQIAGTSFVFLTSLLAFSDPAGEAVSRLPEASLKAAEQSFAGKAEPAGLKEHWYHRAPRMAEQGSEALVEIEEPPKEPELPEGSWVQTAGPSLTMALPMMLGFGLMRMTAAGGRGLYLYSGLVMTVSSSFLSVFWAVTARRRGRERVLQQREKRHNAYLEYLTDKYRELESLEQQYRALRLQAYPDPAECLRALGTKRLWERAPYHPDFLHFRLGLGTEPSPIEIRIPKTKFRIETDELTERPGRLLEEYREMPSMPVMLDGSDSALWGLVGGERRQEAAEMALLLALQMASACCYTELRMAFLYDGSKAPDRRWFRFARWLPHVWEESGRRLVAESVPEAQEVLTALTEILRRRREQQGSNAKTRPLPQIMVFVAEYRLLEQYPLAGSLLHAEPELGITTWILARREEELPHQCQNMAVRREEFQGLVRMTPQGLVRRELLFDHVTPEEMEQFARQLTSVRVRERREAGAIPASLTFLELCGVHTAEELRIEERWLKNRTYQNIRGELGVTAGGERLYLDLHEKYHGPHGLVAGTTGSGKSECLQTLLLSLAVNYSPEELAFFLIDYKGGGMAGLFEGMPHLVGSISNLSGGQTYRAMVSIKSENRRRQQLFLAARVNNISEYTRRYRAGEAETPIPHLLLVIDEFAELKREEPEFMQELISVAQVGRSLGVHLILATQKPSGVVDEHIRGNSRFRICLRVQDRQDSVDLLHHPDAAYLTNIGRGYLQVGNDEVYCEFQAGYSGAPYRGDTPDAGSPRAVLVTSTGRRIAPKLRKGSVGSAERTELFVVKEAVCRAAAAMQLAPLPRLWMPELPKSLTVSECRQGLGPRALQAVVGLLDDPENQRQIPLRLSFPDCGSVAILGMASSGKSTLLLTLLLELMTHSTPEQLAVWGIDYSSGLMKPLERLPHVTGVWCEPEEPTIRRVFYHLKKELLRRKQLLAGSNHRRYVEQGGKNCPLLLLAVDNYPGFREKTGEAYENLLMRIAKEGAGLGILLVLTGTGISMTEIPGKLFGFLQTALCLQLGDRFAYGEALRTMQLPGTVEAGIPGRGLALWEEQALEFQAAVLTDEEGASGEEAILALCGQLTKTYGKTCVRALPEIPEQPTWGAFRKLIPKAPRGLLPLGYEDCSAEPAGFCLSEGYCYLLTGERRTGRKNCLKIMLRSMLELGGRAALIRTEPGELSLRESSESLTVLTGEELFRWFRDVLTPLFRERGQRRSAWLAEGRTEEQIAESMEQEGLLLIAIPDLRTFLELVRHSAHGISAFLGNLLEKGRGHGIYFAAVMETSQRSELSQDPLFRSFCESRAGIRFGGYLQRETVLSYEDLSYQEQSRGEPPGVGFLPPEGGRRSSQKVIVPLNREERL